MAFPDTIILLIVKVGARIPCPPPVAYAPVGILFYLCCRRLWRWGRAHERNSMPACEIGRRRRGERPIGVDGRAGQVAGGVPVEERPPYTHGRSAASGSGSRQIGEMSAPCQRLRLRCLVQLVKRAFLSQNASRSWTAVKGADRCSHRRRRVIASARGGVAAAPNSRSALAETLVLPTVRRRIPSCSTKAIIIRQYAVYTQAAVMYANSYEVMNFRWRNRKNYTKYVHAGG